MSTIVNQLSEFCREVRRRREALGLTLEVLAARSGLTPNYIGGIEIGRRDPSLSTVHKLAHGLGVAPGELFRNSYGLSPAGAEAARLFDQIPEPIRTAIIVILKGFKKKRG